MDVLICQHCGIKLSNEQDLNEHILQKHRSALNIIYTCPSSGCGKIFHVYNSFYQHCSRHHGSSDLPSTSALAPTFYQENIDEIASFDRRTSNDEIQSVLAHFLLTTRTSLALNAKASSTLARKFENFLQEFSAIIRRQICADFGKYLPDIEQIIEQCPELLRALDSSNICQPFRSVFLQNNFIRKNFFLVEAVPVKLGERFVKRKDRSDGRYKFLSVDCVGYFVPFLNSLAALLRLPEVSDELMNRVCSTVEMQERALNLCRQFFMIKNSKMKNFTFFSNLNGNEFKYAK